MYEHDKRANQSQKSKQPDPKLSHASLSGPEASPETQMTQSGEPPLGSPPTTPDFETTGTVNQISTTTIQTDPQQDEEVTKPQILSEENDDEPATIPASGGVLSHETQPQTHELKDQSQPTEQQSEDQTAKQPSDDLHAKLLRLQSSSQNLKEEKKYKEKYPEVIHTNAATPRPGYDGDMDDLFSLLDESGDESRTQQLFTRTLTQDVKMHESRCGEPQEEKAQTKATPKRSHQITPKDQPTTLPRIPSSTSSIRRLQRVSDVFPLVNYLASKLETTFLDIHCHLDYLILTSTLPSSFSARFLY